MDQQQINDLPTKIEIEPDEVVDDQEPLKITVEDEEANLIPVLEKTQKGRDALKEIASNIKEDFETEWESQDRYRKDRAEAWKMFAGNLPEKDDPFRDMANVHIPIMLENMSRLVCRAHSEIFSDEQTIFGVQPVGPDDQQQADILSLHGNWQITQQIPDFFRQMDRALHFYFFDEVFCHSYYDQRRKQNRHEVLSPDEIIVPFTFASTMPDLSDCPWYVRIRHYYKHDLKRIGKKWSNIDKVLEYTPDNQGELEEPLSDAVSEVNKKEKPESARVAPYRILQYEGWCDEIPGQKDERWIQAYLDYASGELLYLTIHEETPWQEQLRYQKQVNELEVYQQQVQTTGAAPAVVNDLGMPMPAPEPPIPPMWMKNPENAEELPEPPRKDPIHMFTHAVCIEMPAGSAGLGFGTIESNLNRAANILLCQYIDTATAANIRTIFNAGLEFEKDKLKLGPFRMIKVTSGATGQELKDKLIPLELAQANPQMVDLVKFITEFAQSSIQSPNVLSGEPGKSGETFRGIATRVEQATKQLSVYSRKFCRDFLTPILKNNAKLNELFLDDEEIFSVVSFENGAPQKINRSLYRRDYKVTIHADLKFTSDAVRIQQADEILKIALSTPQLQTDIPLIYAAIKNCLEARGCKKEIIALLGPAPSPPTTTFGMPPPPPPGPPPGMAPSQPLGPPPAVSPPGIPGPVPQGQV